MTTALIAGGGVAGPTAALALQRAGVEPVVFEAYPPSTRDAGSYFTITPNGLDALRTVGALDLARSFGIPTRKNVLWNERGRRLAEIPLGAPLADGTTSLTMKRSHLGRALREEAIRRGVRVELGKRLVDAVETPDGRVVARFEDGSEAAGDLLIGADGIHSRTRRLIDPGAPGGRYVGLTNFGGHTREARLDAEPAAWHMVFGRRAFFGYLLDASGGAVWFANVPRREITPAERAATSAEAWRGQLVELFAGDAGPAGDLIRRGELELAGDNTFDLPHVPAWHRGRLLVIGDAAHAPSPSSGQGASMAMEDAVVLATCLRGVDSVPEAFATFERLRRDRVERIVAQGARSSSSKIPGPLGRMARDLLLRLMLRFFVTERSLAWMYDYRIDWGAPVSVPPAPRPRAASSPVPPHGRPSGPGA
jgi:2-polyprenyl-6-methoxyphenol hydroxylase-like FAD-dependent oxidoreductase